MIEEKLTCAYNKKTKKYYIYVNPFVISQGCKNYGETQLLIEVPENRLIHMGEATEYTQLNYVDYKMIPRDFAFDNKKQQDKEEFDYYPPGVTCSVWTEPIRDMVYIKIQKRYGSAKEGLVFSLTEEMIIYQNKNPESYTVYTL